MRSFNRILTQLLLAVCGLLLSALGAADDSFYDIPAPGQRIDLGGYKMHIYCQGNGSPTVILDAGLGDWSSHWLGIQGLLKNDTRVCAYDRAGYGWSDPGPRPRYSGRMVEELHSLLDKAGIAPPYLLVGHSFGGLNMRLFASRYAEEVQGLVLVDASHAASLMRGHGEEGSPAAAPLPIGNQMTLIQPGDTEDLQLPAEAQAAISDSLLHTKSIVTGRAEFRSMSLSVAELSNGGSLGKLPLIVISRGRRAWPEGTEGDAQEAAWQMQQVELSKLSSQGSQRIAHNSKHYVQLDEPQIVVDAVRELIHMHLAQMRLQ